VFSERLVGSEYEEIREVRTSANWRDYEDMVLEQADTLEPDREAEGN
jgi:hypothetical protein